MLLCCAQERKAADPSFREILVLLGVRRDPSLGEVFGFGGGEQGWQAQPLMLRECMCGSRAVVHLQVALHPIDTDAGPTLARLNSSHRRRKSLSGSGALMEGGRGDAEAAGVAGGAEASPHSSRSLMHKYGHLPNIIFCEISSVMSSYWSGQCCYHYYHRSCKYLHLRRTVVHHLAVMNTALLYSGMRGVLPAVRSRSLAVLAVAAMEGLLLRLDIDVWLA